MLTFYIGHRNFFAIFIYCYQLILIFIINLRCVMSIEHYHVSRIAAHAIEKTSAQIYLIGLADKLVNSFAERRRVVARKMHICRRLRN